MIKNLLDDNDGSPPESSESTSPSKTRPTVISLFDQPEVEEKRSDEPYILSDAPLESSAETVRASGLAWSMGVVFVVSVVFLMILGWGADLLFGSSPAGLVVGIVVGSLIGFYQLFRISSQIFKK